MWDIEKNKILLIFLRAEAEMTVLSVSASEIHICRLLGFTIHKSNSEVFIKYQLSSNPNP